MIDPYIPTKEQKEPLYRLYQTVRYQKCLCTVKRIIDKGTEWEYDLIRDKDDQVIHYVREDLIVNIS